MPAQAYEFAEWRLARVGPDYHVEAEKFFYSVPMRGSARKSMPA